MEYDDGDDGAYDDDAYDFLSLKGIQLVFIMFHFLKGTLDHNSYCECDYWAKDLLKMNYLHCTFLQDFNCLCPLLAYVHSLSKFA